MVCSDTSDHNTVPLLPYRRPDDNSGGYISTRQKRLPTVSTTMSFSSSDLDDPTLSKTTRNRIRANKRIKRRGTVSIVSCDRCSAKCIPCVKMSSGRGQLTCAECRRRGVPCVSMSWNAVEKAMDISEKNLADAEADVQDLLKRLMDAQSKVFRRKRELEFA